MKYNSLKPLPLSEKDFEHFERNTGKFLYPFDHHAIAQGSEFKKAIAVLKKLARIK